MPVNFLPIAALAQAFLAFRPVVSVASAAAASIAAC
jgi:hypothetical protein